MTILPETRKRKFTESPHECAVDSKASAIDTQQQGTESEPSPRIPSPSVLERNIEEPQESFLLETESAQVFDENTSSFEINGMEFPSGLQGSPFVNIDLTKKTRKELSDTTEQETPPIFKTKRVKPVKLSSVEQDQEPQPDKATSPTLKPIERIFVTKIMRQRDGGERVVETSESVSPLEALPEDDEPEKVEEVKDSRGRVTKRVTTSRAFLSTKKTVVKKSRVLPDGSEEPLEKDAVEGEETKEVKAPVIKRVVKRVVRQPDGKEKVVEEPQSVQPFEVRETKEDSKPEVTEKRERGKKVQVIKKKVVETFQRRVTKRATKRPDGRQEGPIEEEVIKPVEPVNFRIVRRTTKHPDGKVTVTEEPEFDMPDDAKPSVEEVKDRRGSVVRRVTTKPVAMITVRKVYRTIILSPDGREESVQERVEQRQEPGKPGEEEPRKEPADDGRAVTIDSLIPTDEKPEIVTVEDGRVTRKTVTIRKRIVKRVIVMPDGTRREVEEEVDEPVEQDKEDDQFLIIDRLDEKAGSQPEEPRQPYRERVRPDREEPGEEPVKPMDVGDVEALPTEPARHEPDEKAKEGAVTRRTVTVRKRIIRRVVVMPDGSRKEVEEEVDEPGEVEEAPKEPERPEMAEADEVVVRPMDVVEDEALPVEPEMMAPGEDVTTRVDEDGGVLRRIVTVRKRIVKRIIVMPDGTRKEIEEEVPVSPDDKEPATDVHTGREGVGKEPRHMERVFVTKIMRQRDGGERVVETSESVSPLEALPEDDEPEKVEEVKDSRGRVTKRVTTSRAFLSTKKTVVKKSRVLPDGSEEPLEKDAVEGEETKEVKAPVIKRVVKRVVRQPDGKEKVVEEPQSVQPFEVRETKEDSKPEVTEKRERGKKVQVIKKKVVETFQRRVTKRATKRPDGRQEGPIEEEVIKPVEPVNFRIVRRTTKHPDGKVTVTEEPEFDMPDDAKPSVEEVKDRRGSVVRRVTTKPVAMITVRKVYRTIILSPDGREESVQERVEQRQEPGKPGEEEPRKEPADDGRAVTIDSLIPTDEKPEIVTVEDGRVTRKTVTIRKRIVKRVIVMPDGTRREVEEEVDEPVEQDKEDDQFLIIDRLDEKAGSQPEEPRQPYRERVRPDREEPGEEPVKPMDVGDVEALPTEPARHEPDEKAKEGAVTRRTVTVRKRIIRRVVVMPDGSRKEVEEEVDEPGEVEEAPKEPERPEMAEADEVVVRPMDVVEDEALPVEPEMMAPGEDVTTRVDEDGGVLRRIVTVRKRIVKRIIVMPDGTRKEIEEEVPVSPDDKEPATDVHTGREGVGKEPRHVERVFVTKIMRQRDGGERVVETSESVSPLEALPEDDEPEKVEEVKDSRGRVTKRVTTSRAFLSTKKTVVKKSRVLPDGSEEPLEKDAVEGEETKEVKAPVIKRVVKRVVRQPDGKEKVVEEPQSVQPFEVRETKEDSKPEVTEKRERGKKVQVIKKKVVETFQRRVTKRATKRPDGRQEGPIEEEVIKPVEPVNFRIVRRTTKHPDGKVTVTEEPEFDMPDDAKPSVEEVKDRRGSVVRRVTTKPVAMITVRKVYRTIILSPDGREESVQERVEQRQEPGKPGEEEPRKEPADDGRAVTIDSLIPTDEKPEIVTVEDGRVTRKTVTIRKRIVKRVIVMPDGTRREVEEEVDEPVEQDKEDDQFLIIDRLDEKAGSQPEEPRQPYRERVRPDREEPGEEPVKPMDVGDVEALPTEPARHEPDEKAKEGAVTRRTVTVRKRIIRRVVVMPDGSRKEVEEEVDEPGEVEEAPKEPERPEMAEADEVVVRPMDVVEDEALPVEPEMMAPGEDVTTRVDEDGGVLRRIVTVRKRIVKRIIVMPDGTRKEIEEEVPVSPDDKEPATDVHTGREGVGKEPRHVERVFVTKIMRQRDGGERVVETSESVSPLEALPEDDEPEKVEEVKDSRGRVTKRVTTSRAFLSTKKTVVKKSRVLPDGSEEPLEKDAVEGEETKEVKAPVIKRVVKRVVRQPDGKEKVVEEPQSVQPFEVRETKEDSKPEVTEKRERGKKVQVIKKKVVETFQRRVTKRATKRPDGRQEGPIEEEVIKPVEPVNFRIVRRTTKHPDGKVTVTEEPEFDMPDDAKPSVEEVKDRRGSVVRRVTTKPVAMITVRKVYRTIILSPDGREESVQERVEQRQEPGKPGEEEPRKEPADDGRAVTIDSLIPTDEKPEIVTVEDGRVTRKTVTIRKRIVKRVIVMPDGTRREVEEEVDEPVEQDKEDDQFLIIDRLDEKAGSQPEEPRQPYRERVRPDREEPGEEPVKPMDVGDVEALPTEPARHEPDEKAKEGAVTRRTVTVRKRIIRRVVVMPDGSRKEVEEEVDEPGEVEEAPKEPERPEMAEADEVVVRPMDVVEDEALPVEPEMMAPGEDVTTRVDEDGGVLRRIVTVRKRIVKRIIVMPDGTRKEIEEEVPVSPDDKEPATDVHTGREGVGKEPRHVERVFVTKIMRQRDGGERVVETSESVSPLEALPEDDEPEKVEEVKDSRGRVTKRVTTSRAFLSTKKTVVKKSRVLPDGSEEPLEKDAVEGEETKEVKAPVIKRVVKRVVRQPDGKEKVVEEPQSVQPFEVRETKEDSKPEVTEKRERGKKVQVIKKKVVETFQRRVTKRATKRPDGRQEGPIEEEVIKPVEPVNFRIVRRTTKHPDGKVTVTEEPEFDMPDDAKPSVEEVKDRRGSVVRRVTTKPVAMITVRKVYRTIILSPDGREESVQERVEQRQEPGKPGEEEPRKEPADDGRAVTIDSLIPTDEKPEIVTVEDGRVTRKTVTIRKRIVKRVIVMPDGTRREVEEEVDEPVEQDKEDDQFLIIDRLDEKAGSQPEEPRQPYRERVRPDREEPGEEPVKPMDVGDVEALPTEPARHEPDEKAKEGAVTRRTVTVRKRIIRRVVVMPDGSRKEVEEEVDEPGEVEEAPKEPERLEMAEADEVVVRPMDVVEDEALPVEPEMMAPGEDVTTRVDEDGGVLRRIVTVRKRIVKRIIVMPDGTRKEIEEEVPVSPDDKEPATDVHTGREGVGKEPRHVERVFVTKIMRQRDGGERVVETSESVSPLEALPEDDEPEKVEEVKDSRGRVTKRVTTSRAFLSTKKTVVKKSRVLPDGSEEPLEKDAVEGEETKEVKAPVIKRVVKRVVRQPDGKEKVVEEPQSVQPFEVRETKEDSKPEVTEKRERGKKVQVIKKKVVETFQRRVTKRATKRPDGRQEGPIEEEVIKPVEPVNFRIVRRTTKHPDGKVTVTEEPEFDMPDDAKPSVEEVKDRRGSVVRRVTTKPVAMITVRKVYRTIILSPDGREESVQERVEQRQEPGKPGEEEPRKEPADDGRAVTIDSLIPTDEKPEIVTVEDGRVTRKTVTIRKRIVKRVIVMPDGTRREVEEEVDEPVEQDKEDDQFLIIDRLDEKAGSQPEEPRQPYRERVRPDREEPGEEPVKPMDVGDVEALPTEPARHEPDEKAKEGAVTRRTVTVRKRIIRRVVVMPDGSRKEVEEEVDEPGEVEEAPKEPERPEMAEADEVVVRPMDVVEDEALPVEPEMMAPGEDVTTRVDEDGGVLRRIVTVRKRIVKRIIVMPDGTRKEIEEEVPVSPDDKEPATDVHTGREGVGKEPRHVERVFVTKIMWQRDGGERVVETSESVSPLEALPEDDEPEKVEEVKDSRGRVTKRVTTSRAFLSTKKTVVKKSRVLPDGSEEPLEKDAVEGEETKEVKAPVIKRVVKRVVRQPDGKEKVVEEPQSVQPFEVRETKEDSKPEVTEKRERGKKVQVIKKKVVETFQRRVTKRATKRPDGRQEGPIEEEVIKPVEPVNFRIVRRTTKHPDGKVTVTEEPEFDMPDDAKPSVEEVKDRRGSVVRRVTTKPVAMITVRKVYRTIILSPDGREESVQERVEQRQEPGKPGEEEPRKEPADDGRAVTIDSLIPTDEKPEIVTVEDGRVTRKTVTIRKRIVKRVIVMPDGTRREVEEEVDEPVEQDKEDDQFLIIDRLDEKAGSQPEEPRQPYRERVRPDREEPGEEPVKPMDVGDVEALPTEPARHEPDEKAKEGAVTRRTVTVRKRIIRRVVVMPDGSRKEVEEEVDEPGEVEEAPKEPERPEMAEADEVVVRPMDVVEDEALPVEPEMMAPGEDVTTRVDEDGGVLRRIVTVRKRIVKRIIVMPDGTRKEIEEEVPVSPDDKEPATDVHTGREGVGKEPRHVERVFVTKIMRQRDGGERVVETSESVSPLEALPEDDEPEKVEEVKDSRGRVIKRVTTSRAFLSTKKTVVKKSRVLPDGSEEPLEKDAVEGEETKEVKAPVIKRVVKRVVRQPDGKEKVVEEPQSVQPFEVRETKEDSKPEVTEKRERGKKVQVIKKKVVETFQRRVTKRATKRPDGRQEGPIEEEVIKPVEPVNFRIVRRTTKHPDGKVTVTEEPEFDMPDDAKPSVEEVKDRRGSVVRRVTTKPVAMITVRKVYRTIILSPDGREESVQERVEQRQEPGKPGEEEPRKEPADDGRAVTIDSLIPTDEKPEIVTVEDGRVTRKTVTIRKRIVKRVIVMPDGTRREVEEEVDEPVEQDKEDDQFLIIDRLDEKAGSQPEEPRQPYRERVRPDREEPGEEPVKPMDVGDVEALPTEPARHEPDEKAKEGAVTRRTVTVRKRIIRRVVVMPDGSRKEVEEEVDEPGEVEEAPKEPERPEMAEADEVVVRPMDVVEDEALPVEPEMMAPGEDVTTRVDEDGGVLRRIVTVRKRIVKRIIVMPDGTRKEIEEEVPVSPDDKEPATDVHTGREGVGKEPRHVERVFVTKIMRQRDGSERVVETSESVSPLEALPEDDEPEKVEEVKDSRGRVTKRVTTSRAFLSTKKTVVKKSRVLPDGSEEPLEKDAVEGEETKEVKAPVIKRVMKRVVRQPDGKEKVVEEPQSVQPFEVRETKEDSKPEVTEKRERGKKVQVIKKKVVETFQRRVTKRATKRPDGLQEGPVEEEILVPVESVSQLLLVNSQDLNRADEFKDSHGNVSCRVVCKPLPVITTRKVFRTVVLAPDWSQESVQERVEDYQKKSKDGSLFNVNVFEDGSITSMSRQVPVESLNRLYSMEPKLVEKVCVTRIVKYDDGSEQTIGKSETLSPLIPDANDERPEYTEEVKDSKGNISQVVTVTPFYFQRIQEVMKTSKLNSEGQEELLEEKVTKEEKPSVIKAPVIKRINKKVFIDSRGEEGVNEEVEYVEPFEMQDEIEIEKPVTSEEMIDGRKCHIVKRKFKVTTKWKVLRRTYKEQSGIVCSPQEEIEMKYVEPISFRIVEKQSTDENGHEMIIKKPKYTYPDDAVETEQLLKDEKGKILKKLIVQPVPAITARKISRTIVLAPDGTEQSVRGKVDEGDQMPQLRRFFPFVDDRMDSTTYLNGGSDESSYSGVQRGSADRPGESTFSVKMIEGKTTAQRGVNPEQSDVQGVSVEIVKDTTGQSTTTIKQLVQHTVQFPDGRTEEVSDWVPAESIAELPRKEPHQVQRIYQTKLLRQKDGSELVIQTLELATPISVPEDEIKPEKEQSLIYLKKEAVFEKSFKVDSDGEETLHDCKQIVPEEVQVVELPLEECQAEEARSTDSHMKEWLKLKPYNLLVSTDEGKPEMAVVHEKGKAVKIMKRKLRESKYNLVSKKEADDGKPVTEEEAVYPLEPKSWRYVKKTVLASDGKELTVEEPDYEFDGDEKATVETVKSSSGKAVRNVQMKPFPAITSRKIFETIVLSPKGIEISRTSHTEDAGKGLQPEAIMKVDLQPVKYGKEEQVGEIIIEKPSVLASDKMLESQDLDEPTYLINDADERFVIRGGKKFIVLHSGAEEKDVTKPFEVIYKHPWKVERVFSTAILRSKSGHETILQQSETVVPIGPDEDQHERTDEIKDKNGVVVNKVVTTPIGVSQQSTYVKKSTLLPDGEEIPKGRVLISKGEPKQTAPLRLKKKKSEGKGKAKDVEICKPFKLKEVKMSSKPDIVLKKEHGDNVRVFKQKVTETVHNKAVKRMWKTPEGKSQGLEEEIVIEPTEVFGYEFVTKKTREEGGKETEVVEPVYQLPSDVYAEPVEVKDRKSSVTKRNVKVVLPVVTARKVYRVTILSPEGEEISVNERFVEQQLPKEPEGYSTEEMLFPSVEPMISETKKGSVSPERKSPSPTAGRKSPTSQIRKSPVADRKLKAEGKRTPSPEAKSVGPKGKVTQQVSKRKSIEERRPKPEVEEDIIPLSFNEEVESALGDEMFDSMPNKDLMIGAEPIMRMTVDYKNDMGKLLFPCDLPRDFDYGGDYEGDGDDDDEHVKPKERLMPRRFDKTIKKVAGVTYSEKLKDYTEKQPKLQSVEKTVGRFGQSESLVKTAWEEFVDVKEIKLETLDFESYTTWLNFIESELASQKPASSRRDVLEGQKEYNEVCSCFE